MSEDGPGSIKHMQWINELSLQCEGVVLQLMPGLKARPSTQEVITLFKDPSFIQAYVDLLEGRKIDNVVEIGVKHGGSAIFFWHLLQPNNLCCIELNPAAPMLTSYIEKQHLGGHIYTHFGINQGDKVQVNTIVKNDFSSHGIDLVIDDASHIYSPSRATFETLFPLVRPGGLYILEDWRASLLAVQRSKGTESEPPLDTLVHEILTFATVNPHIIPSISSNKNFVVIERGEGSIPEHGFSVDHISEYFVPAEQPLD
jgi:predicted O-methyltransferase YrrM